MATMRQTVLILGGGYAGVLAAARLAQKRLPLDITLVDSRPVFVERIRLHQVAVGEPVPLRPLPAMLPKGVAFRQGRVVALDPAAQRVTVETATGDESLAFDWLVYALGSGIDVASVPGVADHAHTLSGPEAAERLHGVLQAQVARGGRVLVVGGGLTGIESSAEIAESFPALRVELLMAGRLGDDLSAAGQAHLRGVLNRLGVAVREDARVMRLTEGAAHLADGGQVRFDVCLWTGGFSVSPLAREAGLPVNPAGRLLTDDTLRVVGHDRIFAVGDAAQAFGGGEAALRMACATSLPMGAYGADTLDALVRGDTPRPFRFGYAIRCISLGRRDGLVQFVHADDTPTPRVLTGRAAALVKEAICRYTVLGLQGERTLGRPLYTWPQPRSAQRRVTAQTPGRAAG